MTIDAPPPPNKLTRAELNALENKAKILRAQIQSKGISNVDVNYLVRLLTQFEDVLPRMAAQVGGGDSPAGGGVNTAALRFETLYNFSTLLGKTLKLDDALRDVIDAILQITGAERGFLLLRDQDGELRVKIARNSQQEHIPSDASQYSTGIVEQVANTAQPVLSSDAATDPSFLARQSVQMQVIRGVMASPLMVRNRVIGVAYVDSRLTRNLFSHSDLEMLDAICSQAAAAVDNAMLFSATDQALNERLEELRDLRWIDQQLNATLDRTRAAQIALTSACKLSGAEWGALGIAQGEGQPLLTLAWHGREPDFPALDTAYPAVQDARTAETPLEFADGGHAYMVAPLRLKGEFIGAVLLARTDETPFSENERDLAQRVVTRAAISIENARLYDEVRASSQAKSQFVGYVAHELKTPMVSMRGYADLLLSAKDLQEKYHNYAGKIRSAVERMMILTSDLSNVSRIETGHVRIENREVNVHEVIDDVCAVNRFALESRGHTLTLALPDNLPVLFVDRDRLWQVLNNLLSNAIKYTPDGGKVTISAEPDGVRVRFSVADTGIGLSAEEIAKLGGHFWRAESAFVREQPGTGLGFSITRLLVQLMGSEIRVDSTPGVGSRFSFSVATVS